MRKEKRASGEANQKTNGCGNQCKNREDLRGDDFAVIAFATIRMGFWRHKQEMKITELEHLEVGGANPVLAGGSWRLALEMELKKV